MIAGIGTDIIEVERIEVKISKNSGFREFVFSENEIKYCEAKTNKYEHYAACFTAKEAFLKALGTGWTEKIDFREIEVYHNEDGKPELKVSGITAKKINLTGNFKISVSLSHLKKIALAMVVLEKF